MQALWKLSQKATAAAPNRKQVGTSVKPALLYVLSWTLRTPSLSREELGIILRNAQATENGEKLGEDEDAQSDYGHSGLGVPSLSVSSYGGFPVLWSPL